MLAFVAGTAPSGISLVDGTSLSRSSGDTHTFPISSSNSGSGTACSSRMPLIMSQSTVLCSTSAAVTASIAAFCRLTNLLAALCSISIISLASMSDW